MKISCWVILFISACCGVYAQSKPVSEMSRADVSALTADELYRFSLEEIIRLSEIAGISVDELYEMVSTSSRAEELKEEAPNVMHVITREEIRHRGYRNLREALISVPGFGVFMKDVQYVAQVRGIAPNDNEKISFMLDGHRINQMSEPDILNSPINLSHIERIEIIAGPGSVLYGAESLVAIVNMIARKAYANEISVTAGVPEEYAVNASMGKVWDADKSITFSFTGMQREGWNAYKEGGVSFNPDVAFNQLARANSTMPQRIYPSFFLTASGQYEGWSLGISSFNYSTSRIGWAGAISLDEREKLRNQDYINSVTVKHESKLSDQLGFRFSASFDSKQTVQPNNLTMSENVYKTEAGIHHTTKRNFLQAGLQTGYCQERNNWVYDRRSSTETLLFPLIPDTGLWNIGGYFSDKYHVSDNIKLVGAVRADYHSVLEGGKIAVSPRFAVIYSPLLNFTTKLMFNTATRYPSARASHLNVWDQSNPDRKGRMVTKPERLITVESENIYIAGNTRLSLVGYYQYMKNFITWFSPFMNVGDFSGWGIEATWKTNFTPNISAWANATYNKTDFRQTAALPAYEDGADIPTSVTVNDRGQMIAVPQFSGNAGVDFRFFDKWYFSPKMNYFTRQPATNYDHSREVPAPTAADPEATTTVFDFFYVNRQVYLDAALTCEGIFKGFDIRIAAQNILNNRQQVATVFAKQTYTPQGITVQATLFYSF
ncbi:MAG: TonB-dependent receptor plug domain-containing protein [Bacteroidales bacterium]|jgi:outer membrane cobalamin receptor|nr:TonB-dependent receptor plug domain-containing protein [Bacteroidales bacterium]